MSIELLYTSAEQGLKQGSRGFCTVISTAGTPLNLANRLESLSGYRHLYPPNSADARLNPVSFSHLRLSVGGRVISIVSRIADYGLDYSQRSNKIAHHITLEPSELPAAGPAWLMLRPDLFRTSWDGKCLTPATGPAIAQGDQDARICQSWQSTVGDAGWAGVVAESLSRKQDKPVWIIFSADQSQRLLSLINEAIALLPPSQRWEATFSTYASSIPPDVDCRLRCVLSGSNEARLAPARGLAIDLTRPMPPPPSGKWVELARQGSSHSEQHARQTASTVNAAARTPELRPLSPTAAKNSVELGADDTVDIGRSHRASAKNAFSEVLNDEFKLLPLKPAHKRPPKPPKLPNEKVSIMRRWLNGPAVLVLASSILLLTGAAIVGWMLLGGTQHESVSSGLNYDLESENPDGTDPDGTDPEGTDADGTDPDGTDPEGTNPEGTNPEGTNPEGTNPEGTNPEGTNPEGSDQDGSDSSSRIIDDLLMIHRQVNDFRRNVIRLQGSMKIFTEKKLYWKLPADENGNEFPAEEKMIPLRTSVIDGLTITEISLIQKQLKIGLEIALPDQIKHDLRDLRTQRDELNKKLRKPWWKTNHDDPKKLSEHLESVSKDISSAIAQNEGTNSIQAEQQNLENTKLLKDLKDLHEAVTNLKDSAIRMINDLNSQSAKLVSQLAAKLETGILITDDNTLTNWQSLKMRLHVPDHKETPDTHTQNTKPLEGPGAQPVGRDLQRDIVE